MSDSQTAHWVVLLRNPHYDFSMAERDKLADELKGGTDEHDQSDTQKAGLAPQARRDSADGLVAALEFYAVAPWPNGEPGMGTLAQRALADFRADREEQRP